MGATTVAVGMPARTRRRMDLVSAATGVGAILGGGVLRDVTELGPWAAYGVAIAVALIASMVVSRLWVAPLQPDVVIEPHEYEHVEAVLDPGLQSAVRSGTLTADERAELAERLEREARRLESIPEDELSDGEIDALSALEDVAERLRP